MVTLGSWPRTAVQLSACASCPGGCVLAGMARERDVECCRCLLPLPPPGPTVKPKNILRGQRLPAGWCCCRFSCSGGTVQGAAGACERTPAWLAGTDLVLPGALSLPGALLWTSPAAGWLCTLRDCSSCAGAW